MASLEDRKRLIEAFLEWPEVAALPAVHKNIYRGQVAEMLGTLGTRAVDSFSGKDLDAFLQKKGRSPDAAVAEKVGAALLRFLAARAPAEPADDHIPVVVDEAPPAAAKAFPSTLAGYPVMPAPVLEPSPPPAPPRPVGTTTAIGTTLSKGLQYRTSGPRGAAIKGRLMAGILATGRAFMKRGTPLDLSLDCLSTIDAYFDVEAPDGQPRPQSELWTDRARVVLEIAAYVAAVIVGATGGGTIEIDEDDPEAETNLRLVLPSGQVLNPVLRVIGRLDLGASQSLAAYARFAARAS